jgi:IS5 family transposase
MKHALNVRLDFMLFCGAKTSESVPDSTTIQDYRARITEAGLLKRAMSMLNKELEHS